MKEFVRQLWEASSWGRATWTRRYQVECQQWEADGRPLPPPHGIKQSIIKEAQRSFGAMHFVETGTHRGEMVYAVLKDFESIFTIELDRELHDFSKRRFRLHRHVTLIHGDSSACLEKVIDELQGPSVFWLDGHYSGCETARGVQDSPIQKELESILVDRRYRHLILVDDARCFIGRGGYPKLEELISYVQQRYSCCRIDVFNDVIRVVPQDH